MAKNIVIDEFSVAVGPVLMLFQETRLAQGTASIYAKEDRFYLVSNWHNFSGRSPSTGTHLSPTAAEPDRVRYWWNRKGALLEKFGATEMLRDNEGAPLWWIHPSLGSDVDLAVLPISVPNDAEPYPINRLASAPITLGVGLEVFILGFPYGIGDSGLPIWKRGSIASEPQLVPDHRSFILADTASRPGMSGAPVIIRTRGAHTREDGTTAISARATRLLGVYSGRLTGNDPLDAQLGMIWPIELVGEIIDGGRRDPGTFPPISGAVA